jgi:molybdate transport system permease protein
VVLMLGGNIPGRTQTASIVIFNHVEAFDYAAAQRLSATLLVACFALLLIVYATNRRVREAAAAA